MRHRLEFIYIEIYTKQKIIHFNITNTHKKSENNIHDRKLNICIYIRIYNIKFQPGKQAKSQKLSLAIKYRLL